MLLILLTLLFAMKIVFFYRWNYFFSLAWRLLYTLNVSRCIQVINEWEYFDIY
jgi:hypothetical protein